MKIKRVNLVSNDDLQDLNKALKKCIEDILAQQEDKALWTLMKIQGNLENNLKEEEQWSK